MWQIFACIVQNYSANRGERFTEMIPQLRYGSTSSLYKTWFNNGPLCSSLVTAETWTLVTRDVMSDWTLVTRDVMSDWTLVTREVVSDTEMCSLWVIRDITRAETVMLYLPVERRCCCHEAISREQICLTSHTHCGWTCLSCVTREPRHIRFQGHNKIRRP